MIQPSFKSFSDLVDWPSRVGALPDEVHGTTVLALKFDGGVLTLADRRATAGNLIMYDQAEKMPDGPERQRIIDRMVQIARRDAPWIWGIHPKDYSLSHAWLANDKPNNMARNSIKYLKIDTERYPEIATRYGVQGIPNFVVIRDGRTVFQQAGVVPSAEMNRWLASAGA